MWTYLWIGYVFIFFLTLLGVLLITRPILWLRFFCIFLIVNTIVMVICDFQAYHGQNNMFMQHVLSWVIFAGHFFTYYFLFKNIKFKRIVLFSGILQSFGIVLNIYFFEPLNEFPSFGYLIINLGIILSALLYFYEIYEEEKEVFLERMPLFWINSGTFLLFCSTIFLFLIQNNINNVTKDVQSNEYFFKIISYIYFVYYTMIIIGLSMLKFAKKQKENSLNRAK